MVSNLAIRTAKEAKDEFERCGVSIAEWARSNGFSTGLVYRVLNGTAAKRGQSHEIAVRLGLKSGDTQGMRGLPFP